MTSDEFAAMLKRHDWSYYRSDDYQAFRAGEAEHAAIARAAKANPEFQKMLDDFKAGRREVPA